MDHGSLRDEPAVSRSGPLLDHLADLDHRHARPHSPQQHTSQYQHDHTYPHQHHYQHQYLDHPDDIAALEPPHLDDYAAANWHAFSANALAAVPSATPHAEPGDPDDFYRSYPGHASSSPVKDPMASAVSSSARQPPSLRSNGNGTTPKHPAVPATHRNALRPSQRSASNPVDNRLGNLGTSGTAAAGRSLGSAAGGYGTAGAVPPSVKDLKKKFDQPAPQSASTLRKPVSRTSARDITLPAASGKSSPGVGNGATSSGVPRTTTATRDTGRDTGKAPSSRSTRSQIPTNAQSFASRISRPRTAGSATAQASRSAGTGAEPPSSRPPQPRQNGLLFGEILPEQSDSVTPGFGIEPARPRRTSESSIINPVRAQMRSLSDPDIEPPSPTDWYRAVESGAQRSAQHSASRLTKSQHSRAHSDVAGTKLTLSRPDHGAARRDVDSPISPTSPASPTSRLPRLTKRLNDTSNHASPTSTRSNSPSTFKYSTTSGRSSRQQTSSASRARTPTRIPASRSKTPTHIPSSSRKPPPSNIATRPSSRLNAYVSVPTPKLSPSLRSSRPRQSVATATTAASRMRATERGVSPLRQSRSAPKADETTPRRRKVSVGAIDFAQRRETIKLAYSKSIRESQAREARREAAERRKKELAAVAKAKAEAEAATAAAVANAAAAATAAADVTTTTTTAAVPRRPVGAAQPSEAMGGNEQIGMEGPLEDSAELSATPQPPAEAFPALPDALKLEIPGSFPNSGSPLLDQDEIPVSAISTISAVTEFDAEIQTEPPRHETTTTIDGALGFIVPGQAQALHEQRPVPEQSAPPVLHKRASYQYPFDEDEDEDDSVSIKISLDTSVAQPPAQVSPELTPTRTTFDPRPEPAPTAAPAEDDEYVPRPYTFSSENYGTTVTILGPENDFRPLHKEAPRATIPRTDLPQPDEPPAISAPEIIGSRDRQQDGLQSDGVQAEMESLDRLEDFYTGPRLRDNIAALRDSPLTSSDPAATFEGLPPAAEYQRTPDTSHSLTVPDLLASGNRLSQHSTWTDFSFGSEGRDSGHPGSTSYTHELGTREDGGSFRVVPSTDDLSTCASSIGDLSQSLETSPPDKSDAPPSPMLPELSDSQQHHLPDLATVDGLLPSSELEHTGIAPLPDRAPPRPPTSERELERDSTLYLAESRPDSFAYSHDGRGDVSGAASPQQSISHSRLGSLEPSRISLSETLFEKQAPLTEEEQEVQKRLRQRQLVIRELIDTEDAFVRDMTVVEEIYKGTAEACPNLDSKTVKLIFRNTDEIIGFHAALLMEFKEGASTVYTPKGRRSPLPNANPNPNPDAKDSDAATINSVVSSNKPDRDDEKDRLTSLGPVFSKNIEQLKAVHEVYLRSSDNSSKRLVQIQEDKTVMLWLNECNEVAKELTTAWNLDSLLIKPMQRITKYPDIITHLLKFTPDDHPDREPLLSARTAVIDAIDEINKTKKNFELVGQIVSNRKRKESDVRAGLARAFGKRVDKLQVSGTKTAEDDEYQKLQQQFGDDYLRLQVVLRDVEYYTRNVATYVHEFLQYLSSMELVMRLQPSRDYAHLESKWVQFNVSMRDIEKIALERHLADVRKHVIEPFEQVIRCYGNPSLAMKKRAKRRLDYEKYMSLKANGKKVDKQLTELVEQYEALNDTLKKELPKLSAMTAKVGNICLGKFITIQAAWYAIWKEKVKAPLQDVAHVPEPSEIVSSFQREFALQEERARALSILNPALKGRASQSTTDDASSILSKTRSRPSDIFSSRSRGLSINSDHVPTLPTPDFTKRNSGQFSLSPASSALPSPANYYRDYYSGINGGGSHARGAGSGSPITPADPTSGPVSRPPISGTAPGNIVRPGTGRSFDSASLPRQSSDSAAISSNNRRDSNSTFNSSYYAGAADHQQQHQQQHQHHQNYHQQPPQTRRLSGLFSSALPMPDGPDESVRSSRASSRERGGAAAAAATSGGYNVLWLAASLFEFNIETTKHEAGYPYLTYQAGEIFDVIAEKGELWLAKNQDDPRDVVGWIWSKHFAKLADS